MLEYWWSDSGQGNSEALGVKRIPVPVLGGFYCVVNCHIKNIIEKCCSNEINVSMP